MNILVETAEGTACICGDVIYDIQNQIVDPFHQVLDYEPQSTGNHGTSKRQERAAIKRALNSGTFVLPSTTTRRGSSTAESSRASSVTPCRGPRWPSSTERPPRRGEMGHGREEFRPALAAAP